MASMDVENPGQFRKLELKRFPAVSKRLSSEARYWKNFKNAKVISHYAKISDIDFSPVEPHDLAVSASTRVFIYDGPTGAEKKTLSRFRDVAYSGRFRSDGQLLVAGTGDAYVKVFDLSSRTVLRHFKGHSASVQVARFGLNPTEIMSASDDASVRIWDMPTYKHKVVFNGHRDHVRCAIEGTSSASTWISGSFDHSIRLWDARTGKMTMKMDQGAPVESIVLLPGGGLLAAAGHNGIKIWDLLGGGRMVQHLETHRKAVTCLAVDSTNSRLISGSADQHIKFYDLQTYDVTHAIQYDSAVLSVGISPHNRMLAVGMADGTLSIRQRDSGKKTEEAEENYLATSMVAGAKRAKVDTPAVVFEDFRIESVRRQKLMPYDKFLKSFQHQKALDAAIETRNPVVIASMLDELIQRDRLQASISHREETSLQAILSFLLKYITRPRYSKLLIHVANVIFDVYGSMIGQSVLIDETFVKLRNKIQTELNEQNKMFGLMGTVEMLRSASNVAMLDVDQGAKGVEAS